MIKHFVAHAYFNKIALFNFLGFALLLIGCSSTYTLKDFSSKEKFYEGFNDFAKNKNVKVTLYNDSSLSAPFGAVILNDTLNVVKRVQEIEKTISKNEIKEIKYYYTTNFLHPDFKVILKNGNELKEKNIEILPDSSVKYSLFKHINESIPIDRVKTVNYKNNWLGMIPGFLSGFISSALLGYAGGISALIFSSNKKNEALPFYVLAITTVAGTTMGTIIGWLIGFNYTYQFNP